MEGAAPGLFPSRDPGRSPVERVGFSRARLSPGPPRSPLGWAGSSRALVCGPPSQRGVGSTPGGSIRGPQQCQGSSPPRKRPKVPLNWPPTPPFPACLALGFPAFSHSTGPWASTVPRWLLRGIPGHRTLSPVPPPRSLAVLASVSPLPPPQLLRGLLASFPYSSPRAPPPRALSCLEPKAPARDLRGQRLDWQLMPFGAFLTWSLRPAPPRATPQRECPGDTRPRGQCIPYCGEGGSCFPCTGSTFTPRIDSHHGGKWNSLVGKPHGKDSRESHRFLDPREGKHDTAATAQEEIARA